MALRHIGTDPDTGFNGSPAVWLDDEDGSIVVQGWRITDEATLTQIRARGPIPEHVFDERVVVWNHFAGDGSWVARARCDDALLAKQCVTAFDTVWERAIPHEQYRPA